VEQLTVALINKSDGKNGKLSSKVKLLNKKIKFKNFKENIRMSLLA